MHKLKVTITFSDIGQIRLTDNQQNFDVLLCQKKISWLKVLPPARRDIVGLSLRLTTKVPGGIGRNHPHHQPGLTQHQPPSRLNNTLETKKEMKFILPGL